MPENITPNRRAARLDRRAPFVVDLYDVIGRSHQAGSMGTLQREVPAPAGLGWDLAGIPAGAPIALDLRVEAVTEGVLVTGAVTATYAAECGRCLDPVSDDVVVDIVELFAYPDSATHETTDAEEIYRVVDEALDIEPVVRDAVVLGLPSQPLCRADCAGLCPTCGQRLDDLPDGHSHHQIDPRFAALAERWGIGPAESDPAFRVIPEQSSQEQ